MIIAFADDQTVLVFSDLASVRTECEAIDVEQGTYRFFDELGRSLVPCWITPVSTTSMPFGIKLVGGGQFELVVDPEDDCDFETSLTNAVAIEPNKLFATIPDLANYVAANRARNDG